MNRNIVIKALDLHEISPSVLLSIKLLLSKAFYNSHMYRSFTEDMKQNHEYFKVFIAYDDTLAV